MLDTKQQHQLMTYLDMLLDWRQKFNLTAIADPHEIVLKHFVDSLSLVPHIQDANTLIDIGTGAGFPGLPLKIALPNLRVTLVDSLNKRVNFLNTVIAELGLIGISATHARAEELARQAAHRQSYDIAVSHAVATMPVLAEYCLPFVRLGGHFIAMKGPNIDDELSSSTNALHSLGAKHHHTTLVNIPTTDISHNLVIISKLFDTPPHFPRKAAQIAKKPIV